MRELPDHREFSANEQLNGVRVRELDEILGAM